MSHAWQSEVRATAHLHLKATADYRKQEAEHRPQARDLKSGVGACAVPEVEQSACAKFSCRIN